MNPMVEEKLEAITPLCVRHGVLRLALFGSAASGAFDAATSDLDFLVDFRPMPPGPHADSYFGLLADLEALFGLPIDLVESAALRNPCRRREIEATQVLVHAA